MFDQYYGERRQSAARLPAAAQCAHLQSVNNDVDEEKSWKHIYVYTSLKPNLTSLIFLHVNFFNIQAFEGSSTVLLVIFAFVQECS